MGQRPGHRHDDRRSGWPLAADQPASDMIEIAQPDGSRV
jgi:hypothetical protein